MEEAVEFRIDFRKFAGLRFEEEAPDATTFAVFRERILPIYHKLLKILNEQLEAAGFKIKEVVAVDATLVAAHSKPRGDFAGDDEASWRGFPAKEVIDDSGHKAIARRPALFGYKINLSASVGTGFISALSVCRAAEHESKHLMPLPGRKTKQVLADKGYYGCKKLLKALAIKDSFGNLFNQLGFNVIKDELFRHLVVARLAYPTSKLKTVVYLYRFRGIQT